MPIDRSRWKEELKARLTPARCGLDIQAGWRDLVCGLVDHIDAIGVPYKIFEIKERYGGLHLHLETDVPSKEVEDLVSEAEDRSWHICEQCGGIGSETVSGEWMRTLCNSCFKVWDEESWRGRLASS